MKKSRELNMSIPEVTDKIDVREISENFEIIDKILSANLVKRNTSTTEINVTAYPPYYIMKNTENNPIDYFDPIFEETFTLGPLEEKKFFINAPQSVYITSDVQIEYDYFIPVQEAIASAIGTLDVAAVSVGTAETIKSISETDGKIAVTKQSIAIKSNQVNKMTSYSKATSPSAIATSDSLNTAVGKLEYKVDTNETNISNANTQIADIYNRCGGGKNLFNFTAKKSATFRGITLTNNNDGTFAVSGTSTEKDAYHDFYYSETNIPSNFKKGKTYRMVISGSNNTIAFKVLFYTSSWSAPISTFSNQSFTIPTNATGMIIRISISNANTVVNSTISLMITEQFISDNEVVPYIPTNAELYNIVSAITNGWTTTNLSLGASSNIDLYFVREECQVVMHYNEVLKRVILDINFKIKDALSNNGATFINLNAKYLPSNKIRSFINTDEYTIYATFSPGANSVTVGVSRGSATAGTKNSIRLEWTTI